MTEIKDLMQRIWGWNLWEYVAAVSVRVHKLPHKYRTTSGLTGTVDKRCLPAVDWAFYHVHGFSSSRKVVFWVSNTDVRRPERIQFQTFMPQHNPLSCCPCSVLTKTITFSPAYGWAHPAFHSCSQLWLRHRILKTQSSWFLILLVSLCFFGAFQHLFTGCVTILFLFHNILLHFGHDREILEFNTLSSGCWNLKIPGQKQQQWHWSSIKWN